MLDPLPQRRHRPSGRMHRQRCRFSDLCLAPRTPAAAGRPSSGGGPGGDGGGRGRLKLCPRPWLCFALGRRARGWGWQVLSSGTRVGRGATGRRGANTASVSCALFMESPFIKTCRDAIPLLPPKRPCQRLRLCLQRAAVGALCAEVGPRALELTTECCSCCVVARVC